MSDWISVEDRLPDGKGKDYLVFDGNAVSFDYFNASTEEFAFHFAFHSDEVTHWMPLPAPPESN